MSNSMITECLMQKQISGKQDMERDNPPSFRRAYCYALHDALELMFRTSEISDRTVFINNFHNLQVLMKSLGIELENPNDR